MNVYKIKEQLRTKGDAVEAARPKIFEEDQKEEEEEDKNWKNPELNAVIDYDLSEEGGGQKILDTFLDPDIDYKSKKSLSQLREFFYDMVTTYEKFENNI